MFNHFINNTKVQFIALLTILILSVSAVIIFLNYNLNLFEQIYKFNEGLNEITVNTVQLKNSLDDFVKSEHNNEFFELSSDEFTDFVYDSKNMLSDVNDKLLEFKRSEKYGLTTLLKQNSVILNDFETSFFIYVTNMIEIGNINYGYVQNLNYMEERLDIYLKPFSSFYSQFNELRKLSNIYLSSSDPYSAEQFINSIQELKDEILKVESVFIDEREIRFIADALAMYQGSFEQIYYLERVNGTRFYSGLYHDLSKNCDEVIINISSIIGVAKPMINKDIKRFRIRILLLIIFSSAIIISTIILLYQIFTKGLLKISKQTRLLTFDTSPNKSFNTKDMFDQISDDLLKHFNNIKAKEKIIKKLTNKELNADVTVVENNDTLGRSLFELKESMIKDEEMKKDEAVKRLNEDKQKEGIARFGRILRRHVGDIDSLSYELISELVNYIDADIGGLYVVDHSGEKPLLRLRASYAYNEQKMLSKEIFFGEGLIGTCAVDRTTVYFDKIDKDYIKIESGFGHTKPDSLLISPIFVDEEVYGVIELASTGNFTENDVEFIEILAEDIAYTLSYLLSIEVKEE